jgi:alpha-beta hydrolase superfamily lysophospholipase
MMTGELKKDLSDRSIVMSHGAPTAKVFVLLHGLTASPPQFAEFGRRLFDRGANVLIPTLPRHGDANRLSTILQDLHRDELVEFAGRVVAEARRHGDRIIIVGFSLGGLVALWIAQHEPLERVVAIAPFLGISWLPDGLAPLAAQFVLRMPNKWLWWNPLQRERQMPAHGYPRYPTHAVAHSYHLAHELFAHAERKPPATNDIVLVVNNSEMTVRNRSTRRLAALWKAHAATRITLHRLRGLPPSHDVIEPLRVPKIVERIYPTLIELADR